MNILSIKWRNVDLTEVEITYSNGDKLYPRKDYPQVQEWLDAGKIIDPYVEPPIDPKDQARVDALAALRIARDNPSNTDVTSVTWGDLRLFLNAQGIS